MTKEVHDKVKSIQKEIDAIDGYIDKNKERKLKSKYPGSISVKILINRHNDKIRETKHKKKKASRQISKNKSPKFNSNNKTSTKHKDNFINTLENINHFIDEDEKNKLNPKKDSHKNALIDLHNTTIIKNEKRKISKEFKSDLKKITTIIDEKEIEKFKIKYNKDYCDFFTVLEMEDLINAHNQKLEKKQMAEVFSSLRQKYSSSNMPIPPEVASDLASNYPNMDWKPLIKNFNKQQFMQSYEKTIDDVYYLHDYIRKDDWDDVSLERSQISKDILKYKDGISKVINKFTNEIIDFIANLSNYGIDDDIKRIYLVSIPSSTQNRDKNSSMKKSINIIEDNYKAGRIKFNVGCEKEIINFSNALVRIDDVKTAHTNNENRPKYEDHIRTIIFRNENEYDLKNSIVILLDDITTTGTIMNACGDILLREIEKDKLYKLAIAATAWD